MKTKYTYLIIPDCSCPHNCTTVEAYDHTFDKNTATLTLMDENSKQNSVYVGVDSFSRKEIELTDKQKIKKLEEEIKTLEEKIEALMNDRTEFRGFVSDIKRYVEKIENTPFYRRTTGLKNSLYTRISGFDGLRKYCL